MRNFFNRNLIAALVVAGSFTSNSAKANPLGWIGLANTLITTADRKIADQVCGQMDSYASLAGETQQRLQKYIDNYRTAEPRSNAGEVRVLAGALQDLLTGSGEQEPSKLLRKLDNLSGPNFYRKIECSPQNAKLRANANLVREKLKQISTILDREKSQADQAKNGRY